jgi:hypothetical protein
MITKWWKRTVQQLLGNAFADIAYGYDVSLKSTNGTVYYASGYAPSQRYTSLTTNAQSAGISVGTGDTAATDEDYILENTITTGLSMTSTTVKSMQNNLPSVTLNCVFSNTTASDIIIKEIGYKYNLWVANAVGGTAGGNRIFLLDRTVLSTPLTVPARGNAALLYTLKTEYTM